LAVWPVNSDTSTLTYVLLRLAPRAVNCGVKYPSDA